MVPASFPRFHLCNTLTRKGLQTFDVHVLQQRSPKQAQLCTAGSFGAGMVCFTCVQHQAVPDTVAGSNEHSQSKVNENHTNGCFHIVLLGEDIFLQFPHIVSSAVWFRTGQALLKKAEGSALDVFLRRMGADAEHLLIQLCPMPFIRPFTWSSVSLPAQYRGIGIADL